MKVLVINSGSSSVKYKVYEYGKSPETIAKGMVERIGLSGPMRRISPSTGSSPWGRGPAGWPRRPRPEDWAPIGCITS